MCKNNFLSFSLMYIISKKMPIIILCISMLLGCFGRPGHRDVDCQSCINNKSNEQVRIIKAHIGDGVVEYKTMTNGRLNGNYYLIDTVRSDTIGRGLYINGIQSGKWSTQYPGNDFRCVRNYIDGIVHNKYECENISNHVIITGDFDFDGIGDSSDVGKQGVDSLISIDTLKSNRSRNVLMQIVKAETPKLRFIYNQYLKKRPRFSGVITVKFKIDRDGIVRWASIVSSTTNYSEFDNVILREICSFIYPRIRSGVTTVSIPWTFSE